VDRLFEQTFTPYVAESTGANPSRSIAANVWETADGYHAAFLAPGLDEEKISVTVHEDLLTIEGDLHFQMPEDAKPVWREFGPSHFKRTLRLGTAIDSEKVEAMYRNGLLLVTLPKAEHAKPRQIQVQVGK
jgi:HSP20 family molecular chaperone IbpA